MHNNIFEFLGFGYEPIVDDGSIGMINTPFRFEDGDSIPVYVEQEGTQIRFFDDGDMVIRLMGLGVRIDDESDTGFIDTLISPAGAALSKVGEIEVWVPIDEAPAGFARYISAMLAMVRWEMEPRMVTAARVPADPIDA
jgi:hypothetical protein